MDSKKGSEIAKEGFKTEKIGVEKLNNWLEDKDGKIWLSKMGYNLNEIVQINAKVISNSKSDINIKIQQRLNYQEENIQVKLISNKKGYNQIDKRWIKNYQLLWDIPEDVVEILKYYTGD